MSSLFQHGRRHEFITTNPISLVRQSSIRQKEPEVLTPEEVSALLEELDELFRTIVYMAAVTGMRRGELFGLKWEDVDLQPGQLKIVRSIVDQTVGRPRRGDLNGPRRCQRTLSWLLSVGKMRRSTGRNRIGFLPVLKRWASFLTGPIPSWFGKSSPPQIGQASPNG
jgi:integrase